MTKLIRVIIVEDSDDDVLILLRLLRQESFIPEYVKVETPGDLEKELQAKTWDLIISDYNLPGFSALGVLEILKNSRKDVPMIIVSGVIGEETAVEAMKAGASDYVMKGNLSRLVPAIERELQKTEVRKEHRKMEKKILVYQDQLRSMTSELALTEERERRRIATELHDRIGQNLALSKIRLKTILNLEPQYNNRGQLEDVIKLLEQTIRDTRSLTFEISPPILYELGFEAAVEWLAERMSIDYAIPVAIEDDGCEKPLSDDFRIILFYAVRELLVNVIKHSKARQVNVKLSRIENEINIRVQDDGIGFDLAEKSQEKGTGFGLFSITERLTYMGGKVDVASFPGRGSLITLSAPLNLKSKTRKKSS